ncbi:DsbA family oxidoreductase [Natronococcus sp.]|uniref:DsbA family oxidoreductase n=1 Tax=Natronococcus sp. TaxID=35747 RepID=UPI003A4E474A
MSATNGTDRLTIYADYVCPFCYLGKQSLERYRERREEPLEVEWHPFDLRRDKRRDDGSIDHSVDDGKDDDYFEQARENVRRLQEEYDVEMSRTLAIEVDSLPAQQASWYVSQQYPEAWPAFDAAIYEALWQAERNIGDSDVLVSIAEDTGLPADEIRDAIDDDGLRAELEELFTDSRERGVTGVPTFVHEGYAARGAVPPAQLERLLEGE